MSEEAAEGWEEFATAHGVTVSGLIDAIGEALVSAPLTPWLARIVERARETDNERRRRPRA